MLFIASSLTCLILSLCLHFLSDPTSLGVAVGIPAAMLLLIVVMLAVYFTVCLASMYCNRTSALRRYQAVNDKTKRVVVQENTPSSQWYGQQLTTIAGTVPVIAIPSQHVKAINRPPSYLEAIEAGSIPLPPYPWSQNL